MSEYQYITFRAIDSAVSKKNLAYMRRQSTRAEIGPRSFINEYTFGDFHGNAMEMLRRGYDIHLHYANYGLRSLYFRLPQGLPDSKAAKPYLDGESIRFVKDREGRGGTLAIEPCYEPGDLEELWEFEELIDDLVPLRSEITEGDLRPLYLAHLAVSCDCNHDPEETVEAPVPGGLNQLTTPQRALATLYELRDALIAAAGQEFGPLPSKGERPAEYIQWISQQPEANKNAWLTALMNGSNSSAASSCAWASNSAFKGSCCDIRLLLRLGEICRRAPIFARHGQKFYQLLSCSHLEPYDSRSTVDPIRQTP